LRWRCRTRVRAGNVRHNPSPFTKQKESSDAKASNLLLMMWTHCKDYISIGS
jgi:hypothetical protein